MVRLDDDAKNLLMRYSFPGNVRQLKNIAEQVSILEMDRHIDAGILKKYLPPNYKDELPVALKDINPEAGSQSGSRFDNFTDRDLLIKVLFDMRKDVGEMKQMLYSFTGGAVPPSGFYPGQPPQEAVRPSYLLGDGRTSAYYDSRVQDVQPEDTAEPEEEEETLSLEHKEKELIIKALQKHSNKRKYAAQDLGISERTLYRKIKQYDIESV